MGMWSKKKEAEPEPEPEPEALEPEPEPEPPLRFDRAHVNLLLSDDGVTVVGDSSFRCAASGAPMSGGGRYYAEFTVISGRDMLFGLVAPGWDVERGLNPHDQLGHCFFRTAVGCCEPGGVAWRGAQPAREGDRIGLLVDLDDGSVVVSKNDVRLGLMVPPGGLPDGSLRLQGELCWAVAVSLSAESDAAQVSFAPPPEYMKVEVSKKPGGKKSKRGQTPKGEKPPKKEKKAAAELDEGPTLTRAHLTMKLIDAGGVFESKAGPGGGRLVGGSHVIGGCGYRTAASSAVMAEGRHYAQFVVLRAGKSMFFGVVRPEWDVENKKDAEEHLLKNQKHCFFNAKTGRCYPGGQRWDGMDLMDGGKVVDGDRIGLLLDLTKGSITVFKNEMRLGVMCSGKARLTGEYCWAVSLLGNAAECVRIEGGRSAEEAEAAAVECRAASERQAAGLAVAAAEVIAAEARSRPALERAAAERAATIAAAEAAYTERNQLAFDLFHEDVKVSEDGAVCMKQEVRFGPDPMCHGSLEVLRSGYRTAASAAAMTHGVHFAQFTLENDYIVYCGVVPDDYDVTTGREAHMQPGCCFWDSLYGKRFPEDTSSTAAKALPARPQILTGPSKMLLRGGQFSDPSVDEQTVEAAEAKDRDRALLAAAKIGDAGGVVVNLEASADINAVDGNGWTALTYAIRGDHVDAIEALTAAGARTDTVDKWGRTPMMYAAMLHHQLWPHEPMEGETDSLEWLKDPERGGASLGATEGFPNIDWRLQNNNGGDWEGRQGATSNGDRIGMLLDLDNGTITMYKNDHQLGAMPGPTAALLTLPRVAGAGAGAPSTQPPPVGEEEEEEEDSGAERAAPTVVGEPLLEEGERPRWRWAVSLMKAGDAVSMEAFISPEAAAEVALAESAVVVYED